MDIQTIKDLQEQLRKQGATAEIRSLVRQMADEVGVEIHPRGKCRNCWSDALIEIYRAVKNGERKQNIYTGTLYSWVPPVPRVIVNGIPMSAAMTLEEIEQLREKSPNVFKALWRVNERKVDELPTEEAIEPTSGISEPVAGETDNKEE